MGVGEGRVTESVKEEGELVGEGCLQEAGRVGGRGEVNTGVYEGPTMK